MTEVGHTLESYLEWRYFDPITPGILAEWEPLRGQVEMLMGWYHDSDDAEMGLGAKNFLYDLDGFLDRSALPGVTP